MKLLSTASLMFMLAFFSLTLAAKANFDAENVAKLLEGKYVNVQSDGDCKNQIDVSYVKQTNTFLVTDAETGKVWLQIGRAGEAASQDSNKCQNSFNFIPNNVTDLKCDTKIWNGNSINTDVTGLSGDWAVRYSITKARPTVLQIDYGMEYGSSSSSRTSCTYAL